VDTTGSVHRDKDEGGEVYSLLHLIPWLKVSESRLLFLPMSSYFMHGKINCVVAILPKNGFRC
jgi:hypothetical protein